nr:class I SAM-dependent methyltransferase [Sulfolobus islandicus]
MPPDYVQKRLHNNINFVKGTAYELSKIFKDEYFDVILLIDVIEHLFYTDDAINEIKRVLKEKGIVVISTPNLSSFANRILLLLGYQPLGTEVSARKHYGRPNKYNIREGVAGHIRAFSNKPFGQTSSIVLANIATWVLSTHVAIRGRDLQSLWFIRPIIIPNTPNNPCQLPC